MKKDVETRADLHLLLSEFYRLLLIEDQLSPFFEKFKDKTTLDSHLNDLTDFWDSALFYKGKYNKNVIDIHKRIDQNRKIEPAHFNAWLSLFEKAVDQLFEGENAHNLKSRARSIATVMQIKFHAPS